MLHNRLKERRHVFVVFVQFAYGKTVLRAGVNNREIKLLVRCFQFDEEIENLVQDFVRSRVSLSILLMTTTGFSLFSIALRKTKRVCACGPSCASTTSSTPSTIFMIRSTSPPKSA